MDGRFSKVATRQGPEKEKRAHTKMLDGLAAIIVILVAASTIYAAVWLLPTVLHAILQEFGAYIVPQARG